MCAEFQNILDQNPEEFEKAKKLDKILAFT